MKKLFCALSLCLTLALCVSGSTAEGAVALLRIYARAEDRGDASINSSGHSFLSVRNVSGHDIEVGGLRIAPDTEMTFWPSTAIWLRTIPRSPTTTLFITAPA